jgi:hypothetical protein
MGANPEIHWLTHHHFVSHSSTSCWKQTVINSRWSQWAREVKGWIGTAQVSSLSMYYRHSTIYSRSAFSLRSDAPCLPSELSPLLDTCSSEILFWPGESQSSASVNRIETTFNTALSTEFLPICSHCIRTCSTWKRPVRVWLTMRYTGHLLCSKYAIVRLDP